MQSTHSTYIIEVTKEPPSDEVARQVLKECFSSTKPWWKTAADLSAGFFLLTLIVFLLNHDTVPFFTLIAIIGALVSFTVAFGLLPLLVSETLKANKRESSYYQQKHYRFFTNHMIFSVGGTASIEIPYEKFTAVKITKTSVMFMIGQKMALWFTHNDISEKDLQILSQRLESNHVPVL